MSTPIPAQNLLDRSRSSSIQEYRAPGAYRSLIFDALSVASAAAVGYCYANYLSGAAPIWQAPLAFLVFCTVACMQMLVSSGIGRRIFVLALDIAALLLFFVSSVPVKYLGAAAGVGLIFFLWGELSARNELENNVRVRFFAIAGPLVSRLLTGTIALMILVYLPRVDAGAPFVSQPTFDSFYASSSQLLTRIYKGARFDGTVGDFVDSIVRPQLAGNTAFASLPKQQQDLIVQSAADLAIQDFSKSWGFAINSGDRLDATAYRFIVTLLDHWRTAFGSTFLIGWAIVVFLIVRSVGFLLSWILLFVGYMTYQLLMAFGVIKVMAENSSKERVFW